MRTCFALLACFGLASCGGGEAPSGDAGPFDGGPLDGGGVDAAVVDSGGVDAGSAPACEGEAMACRLRADEASCAGVIGCAWSQCAGIAAECARQPTEASCTGLEGCSWTGAACTGTARDCGTYGDAAACNAQSGCTWSTVAQCRGIATPCAALDAARCEMQPGCRPYVPAPDAGPLDGGPRPDVECVPPEGPPPSPGCNPDTGIECDGDWRGINPRTRREYCEPGCAETECCSPQGGAFRCVPRDAAGRCPAADLFVDAERAAASLEIATRTFAPDDCTIVEGCVAAPGTRRLLLFDTWTPNVGTADMFLGQPSMSSPHFEYSPCHGHYHFNTYAEYELLDESGTCVAATGHKQAFCLLDFYQYPGTRDDGAVYTCGYQGIQRGWQDVYARNLDCQWVDITDVPPGRYTLRIRVNVEHVLNETDYTNNQVEIPVTID